MKLNLSEGAGFDISSADLSLMLTCERASEYSVPFASYINPLRTKLYPYFLLKTQCVQLSKHPSASLINTVKLML